MVLFMGGVVGAIADNAAGYAAYSLMDVEDTFLRVEYKLNLLAPAKGDWIVAQAEVMRPGRSRLSCAPTSALSMGTRTPFARRLSLP